MSKQEIDRIECAIRHIESSLDVDPWAVEIAVEAMLNRGMLAIMRCTEVYGMNVL